MRNVLRTAVVLMFFTTAAGSQQAGGGATPPSAAVTVNAVTATVTLGGGRAARGAQGIALDPSTGLVYIGLNGAIVGGCAGDAINGNPPPRGPGADQMSVINPAQNREVAAVASGGGPVWPTVNPDRQIVYMSNSGSGTVSIHAAADGTRLEAITVGGRPHMAGLDYSTRQMLVTNTVQSTDVTADQIYVSLVDTNTNGVVREFTTTAAPHGVVVDQDRDLIYFSGVLTGDLVVVNAVTGQVVATADPNSAYGTAFGNNNMLARQASTRRLFQVNSQATARGVIVIDEVTLAVQGLIRFDGSPTPFVWGLWVDEPNRLLFAALPQSNAIGVADLDTLTHVATIPVGPCPYAVTVDPARRVGVVSNQGSPTETSTASIIDLCAVYAATGRVVSGCAVTTVAPTISAIANQTVQTGSTVTASFSVADADTAVTSLTLSGTSSDTAVVPPSGIAFGGSGADRTVTITPAMGQTGSATMTVTVSDGVNSASTSFTVTVQNVRPLVGAPTGLRTTQISGNTVGLTWTAGEGQLMPTNHIIEGGITAGSTLGSLSTGSGSASFSFAAPTGIFFLRVKAVAGSSVSAASNEIRIFVNVPAPPSAPINLLGLVDGSSVSLAWQNTLGGGAASSIVVNVTGARTASLSVAGSTEGFSVAGVPPGTYSFSVAASNSSGVSASSNAVTLTFPASCGGAPSTPANFLVTKSGRMITISWDLPASGAAPTSYTLLATGAFVGSVQTTSRTLTGIAGPGSYTFRVIASNRCGTSAATTEQTIVIT